MALKFTCPNCNKNYTVKDELQGKKARCICGSVLRIPAKQVHIRTDMNGLPSTIAPDTNQKDPPYKDTPLTEEHVRKSYRSRFIGFSIGALIGIPILIIVAFLKYNVVAASIFSIVAIICTLVFTFVFLKMCTYRDRRLVEKKMTEEDVRGKSSLSSPQAKIAAIALAAAFCLGILLMIWELFSGTNTFQDQFASFFSTNMRLKIILLICNIPIFIIIIRLMIGSWQKYWRMIKWHFVPFRTFNKRYWDFTGTIFIDDVVLVVGTNILCLFAYILEYLLIKAIFIR
jgi:hypothetical protein